MTICSVSGLNKSYVTQQVLTDINFKIEHNDKIGIIGVNGAGKTTLFKILCGLEEPDEGSIFKEKGLSFAYMQQHSDYTSSKNATEEIEEVFADLIHLEKQLFISAKNLETDPTDEQIKKHLHLQEKFEENGGLTYRNRIRSTLMGLGFSEKDITLPFSALSGGQRTRVLLAKILLSGAKLILLDEPTNHLDINATLWLEDFLINYKGALLLISHDRFFLDRISNKIFDIENAKLKEYRGNYTAFKEQKELNRLTRQRDYAEKQKEIKRIEGIIAQQRTFAMERNFVTIRSKQKQIERIASEMEKPEEDPDEIGFSFKACSGTGNDVLILDKVSKAYGDKALFKDLNLFIKNGERVFLTGENGCGKTTLLKIIVGQELADFGQIHHGARVKIGYYAQTLSELNGDNTIFDELSDAYPKMTNTEIRKALAVFLFRGDDVFKLIKTLSGGEKARVCLVKLMLSEVNFLIMDEPTNHLDISSKEALENALKDYDGTLLMVSHDRYFINRLSTKIYDMKERSLTEYTGNYDDFIAKTANKNIAVKTEKAEKENTYQKRKEALAERRKRANRFSFVEKEIEEKETEIKKLETSLLSPEIADDYKKIMEISDELSQKQKALSLLYGEWEEFMLTEG